MSRLGYKKEITQSDLDRINVVPNPYIVSSIFNESENSNRLYFNHLPDKCEINIFTISSIF